MAETRISVRVDNTTKKQAEAVFTALGINMSTGINIFFGASCAFKSDPFCS